MSAMPVDRLGIKRLIAAATGVAFGVAVGESALRIARLPNAMRPFLSTELFPDDQFVPDAELFWRLAPSWREANHLGMRGPWLEPHKNPNEFRIVAVGDSCTYGYGVDWEETYAIRLERLIQARLPDHVVRGCLAALPGYSTFQNLRFLTRHGAALQADLLVVFCGAWNDYVPAIGLPDASYALENEGLRILSLVRRCMQQDVGSYREAFERGEVPDGRRVEIADFRANLEQMVRLGRAAGAQVVLVAPSHPDATQRRNPGLLAYRQCVLDAGAALAVTVVDLAAVCASMCEPGTPPPPGHSTPCFLDWVHPSAPTHQALAAAIAAAVRLPAPEACAQPDEPAARPSVSVPAAASELDLPLPQHCDPESIRRVWIGPRHAARFRTVDGVLRAPLPRPLPPGPHVVQIVDRSGAHAVGVVEVRSQAIAMSLGVGDRGRTVTIEGTGRPGDLVWVWWGPELAAQPIATQYGLLHLPLQSPVRGVPGLFRFDLATARRLECVVPPAGRWSISSAVNDEVLAELPNAVHAQALVVSRDGRDGALSSPAVLQIGSLRR